MPLGVFHPDDLTWQDGTGQDNEEHYLEQYNFISKTGTFPPGYEVPREFWVSIGETIYDVTCKSSTTQVSLPTCCYHL